MDKTAKILHWTPRILAILAILFIGIFALDAFDPELTLGQQITGLLIHLIPNYILAIILWVAWKREFIGGLIFLIIGLVFTPIIFQHNYRMNESIGMTLIVILTITVPFIIVGALFIWSHYRKKRENSEELT